MYKKRECSDIYIMSVKILKQDSDGIKLEVYIEFKNSMLESEEEIQSQLNEVGMHATKSVLEQFDTDGSPLKIGTVNFTSKGQEFKEYQTPYGPINVQRHVYQTSQGGSTYCPLEYNARIIHATTPKFSKMLCHKYSENNGRAVQEDLLENHGRHVSLGYIQNLSEAVYAVAEAKEEKWTYDFPRIEGVCTVTIGIDGAFIYILGEKYKQVMQGTIALYDDEKNRLYTKYIASPPEEGKGTFKEKMELEIANVKKIYPKARYVGLGDGAKDNWDFLEKHTDIHNLDFFHVTEYLGTASDIIVGNDENKKKEWMNDTCHNLKHTSGYALVILKELKSFKDSTKLSKEKNKSIQSVITYFENNHMRMNYSYSVKRNIPIGSGVTEAACKFIIKQRLCNSGMKWKRHGAGIVLKLRTMVKTDGLWNAFWKKINQYGIYI
jgi:hypothetical protein